MSEESVNQYRSLVIASWLLIGFVCLVSLIPFLGFASWLIVGPILFIALVMGIIILARGGTLQGCAVLLAALIVAPIFVTVAPIASSLLGIGRAVAPSVSASTVSRRSSPDVPPHPTRKASASAPARGKPRGAVPARLAADEKFRKFRELLLTQASQIASVKARRNAAEGPRGFLTGSETLDLAQRELVQRENYYREEVFQAIARHTGLTAEEVAATFASMARKAEAGAVER